MSTFGVSPPGVFPIMVEIPTLSRELLDLVHSRGQWESLEDDEAQALWTVGCQLAFGSRIVEIGCQVGRSSVLLQSLAMARGYRVTFIDPWILDPQFALEWFQGIRAVGGPFTLFAMRSQEAPYESMETDFLYIDGDHELEGVTADCENFLPCVRPGGFVAFHDYGRPSLPWVKLVVDKFMDWEWTLVAEARTMRIYSRG